MNNTNTQNKFVRFLKNNTALLIIIFCALAIAAVVTVVAVTGSAPDIDDDGGAVINPDDDDDKEPELIKVYYKSPLAYTSMGMEFTDGEDLLFVFNNTLNSWKTHQAVDLKAADGTAVTSMFDGTVLSVESEYGMGNIVTIDHGDGVVATYASLGEVKVVKGQVVEQGEQIGTVGTSAAYEFLDGAHLHLEVEVDDQKVDPMPYVNGEIFIEREQA